MSLSKVIELLVLLDVYSKAGWVAGWLAGWSGIKVNIVIALASLEPINLTDAPFKTIKQIIKRYVE